MMLLWGVAVAGKYPYSSNLLDEESRATACRQGSAAKSTHLFGSGFARSPMPGTHCGRPCGPCAYPLSTGEDPIGLCGHGALEDFLLEMVENAGKPHIQLAARVRSFLSKPIPGGLGRGLHSEPRRAPSYSNF